MMLMAMLYMGAHISGGHYNPAVSLAFWLQGALRTKYLGGYVLAQTLGTIAAVALFDGFRGILFLPQPSMELNTPLAVLAIEVLLTFVLATVILTLTTTQPLRGNHIYGLAIGFTLMTLVFFSGVYNPAIALGAAIYHGFQVRSLGSLTMPAIYILGPCIGSGLSAYFCKYINSSK